MDSAFSLTQLQYDGLDRLIEVEGNSGIGNSIISYDSLGNIESYQSKGRDLSYQYDELSNRLTSVTGTGTDGKYSSIQYDGKGNITHNGGFALNYNAANQMTAAKGNQYLYDGSYSKQAPRTPN